MKASKTSIKTIRPETLDDAALDQMYEVAAAGFGRDNDETIRKHTLQHVSSARDIQLARTKDGNLAGFATYGRSLWRPCC